MERESPTYGQITVAPEVLETIVRLTTLAVPGVVRFTPPLGIQRLLGMENGIHVSVMDGIVRVDLHVVAKSSHNVLALARQIQAEVTRAVADIVGLEVERVNVYVEDLVREADE